MDDWQVRQSWCRWFKVGGILGCVIIHLLGFPGVGKHTIATVLSQRATAIGRQIVVVDII